MTQNTVAKATKGTMTDISMMEKVTRPAQLKPSGPPRRMSDFADRDKQRQSDLSDQEIRLARRIWAEYVDPLGEGFVTFVFNEFFTKYPQQADFFTRLESISLPKLSMPEDMVIKNYHRARVLVRLRHMMDSLDHPKRLTKLMTKLGLLYVKTNVDLTRTLSGDFQSAMLWAVKVAMNYQMNPSEEMAYRKCFDMAFSIMEEASFTYYDLFIASQTPAKAQDK